MSAFLPIVRGMRVEMNVVKDCVRGLLLLLTSGINGALSSNHSGLLHV